MKRHIIAILIGTVAAAGVAYATAQLPLSYRKVYCYPTGTYWVKQLSNPNNAAYYSQHNTQLTNQYGATTKYCPNF